MEITDTFMTVVKPSQGLYKEKGSKFMAFLFHVENETEVKEHVECIKKKYHDARHHCYAYSIGTEGDMWRANDDGEPSGTGGRPILGQIRSKNVTNVLIIVVRYFGGILLGVSGLANAYKKAAEDALNSAVIEQQIINVEYDILFPYSVMNDVMRIIKEENARQSCQNFDIQCSITISLRKSTAQDSITKLSKIEGVKVQRKEV